MENSDTSQDTSVIPETDYEIGQDNLQFWGLDVHNPVFVISALGTIGFVVFTIIFNESAAVWFGNLRTMLNTRFDWFFIISVNIFLIVCVALIISPLGRIRIGGHGATPDYNYLSWFAMMFAAGIGIGLMFYGVLEPMNHFLNPPLGIDPANIALAREYAMASAIFHWSLHAWAVYSIVGLSLAFFYYNFGLPLTVRSAFYPLLGEATWGWPGHLIDTLAVFAILFGLATSLGVGAQQVSGGLEYLFSIPNTTTVNIVVVLLITGVALISVVRGLDKGVKVLSEINIGMAAVFCLFAIIVGASFDILSGFISNTVNYLKHLPELSNWIGRSDERFLHDWTTFYWSWWIAWSPFVGMFIARVSRGRTVREFLGCALVVPSLVCIIWMSTFGDSAMTQYIEQQYTGVSAVVYDWAPELAMFKFLEPLPLQGITSIVTMFLVVVFFVTSMDSGALVVDSITAGGKISAPMKQRVFWCCFEGLIAIALLIGGGLVSLQALSLASGFPFCIVLLFMMYSLYKGLKSEHESS